MTLYVFPDPSADVAARLSAVKPSRFPTATISTSFPDAAIAAPHIQHAWDGTPTEDVNREKCIIRVTVWAPKVGGVQMTVAKNLASLVRAVLLDSGSTNVWRYTRGAGRAAGIDKATGLPFCTFTVTAETRPTAVA